MVARPNTHAEPLTKEQKADLAFLFEQRIRAGRAKIAEAMALVKTARNEVNGQFKLVAKDLGYTRLKFEDMLAKKDMDED